MQIEIPNVDLITVETGVPILPDGLYEVKVVSVDVKPSKDGQSNILNLKYSLEQTATTRDGESVSPGFPIFDRVSLKVTEKYNPAKRLASIMDCFLGGRTAQLNTDDLLGMVGRIRLKVREDDTYGTSNEVKSYEKKSS